MMEISEITGTDTPAEQVYTHDIAARIVENFENILDEQDITLISPEDNLCSDRNERS